jgi:hypothetical protein
MDETGRGPQRLVYRVPKNNDNKDDWPSVGRIDMEMNTSASWPAATGDLRGYARNLVVLHNYPLPGANPESDKFIFERPAR